jgi:type IV secretory pathway TraG/TraD family ATPase VirD4
MKINHEYHNHIIGKGMYFSEDTCATNTNNNVLLLGGSGSGKTGSYIVPNIQNIETSLISLIREEVMPTIRCGIFRDMTTLQMAHTAKMMSGL